MFKVYAGNGLGFNNNYAPVTLAADGTTTLRGPVADQSELHGLLDAMSRAGFELVDIRRDPVIESGED